MSKTVELVEKLWDEIKGVDKSVTKGTLEAACKYLGPSLFNKDSSLVAYSDKAELERIRDNFVKKKLGIKDSDDDIHKAIMKVGEKYGMSNRSKKRAIVYACLMTHYGVKEL